LASSFGVLVSAPRPLFSSIGGVGQGQWKKTPKIVVNFFSKFILSENSFFQKNMYGE